MDPETIEQDNDFAAGLEGLPTETPVAQEAQEQPPETVAPKYAQITEEQWAEHNARAARIDEIRATQEKSFGTAFGKIGGIERTLQQLQAGGIGEVSTDDFEKMREEFPDLADMLVDGLNSALKKGVRGTVDLTEIEAKFESRLAKREQAIEQKLEIKHLSRVHKDWREVVNQDEFKQWSAAKPAEFQQQLGGWDGEFIADALTEFKARPRRADAQRDRISAAVTPRGTGGHATGPSDDDDFLSGLR